MTERPDPDSVSASPAAHLVTPDEAGRRLDVLLAALAPDLGLRGRRRLIETGRVTVDGQIRKPGYRPLPGQAIAFEALPAPTCPPALRLVARTSRYAALAKPAGLSSVHLAGGDLPSVEDFLPGLLPGAVLVNRLDAATSGLLLAALDSEAAADYRRLEDSGQVHKTYLAVVHGRLPAPLAIARSLDTARRRKTAVLPADSSDLLRATAVRPLSYEPERDLTLVEAVIRKGARHQIRAHLAASGHPILGDALYGPPDASTGRLHLHHARIELPGFTAEAPVEGDGWDSLRQAGGVAP